MIELDSRQTIIIAILVLFLGKFLNKNIKFLRRFNIPEPVSGGTSISIIMGLEQRLEQWQICLRYRKLMVRHQKHLW